MPPSFTIKKCSLKYWCHNGYAILLHFSTLSVPHFDILRNIIQPTKTWTQLNPIHGLVVYLEKIWSGWTRLDEFQMNQSKLNSNKIEAIIPHFKQRTTASQKHAMQNSHSACYSIEWSRKDEPSYKWCWNRIVHMMLITLQNDGLENLRKRVLKGFWLHQQSKWEYWLSHILR